MKKKEWFRQHAGKYRCMRQYPDKPIPADIRGKLDAYDAELNETGGLYSFTFESGTIEAAFSLLETIAENQRHLVAR